MFNRRSLLACGGAFLLSGCGHWKVAYKEGVDPAVSRNWHVSEVKVMIPKGLTVSNANTFAPDADIVWHGEPYGNRRAQVAAILREGVVMGGRSLRGPRRVRLSAMLLQFHAVTPAAGGRAPAAVHHISYTLQVFDARTNQPLTKQEVIQADLEAYVGAAAVTAAINGDTQRVRIVDHIGRVTRGWLGQGADQRRTFDSVGR